jgi:hypothetical protein
MIFMATFQSFLNATVFHGIGAAPFTLNIGEDSVIMFNMLGAAYMFMSDLFIKLAFGQVQQIPTRIPIYHREVQNHMYSPTAFWMSICISSLTLGWMYPIIMGLLTFYFLGLAESTFGDCLEFTLIFYLIAMAGNYTGLMFGAIFDSHDDGFRFMQLLVIAFNMAAGVFVNTSKRAKEGFSDFIVYWLQFVSPARYSCELLVRREFAGKNEYV